MGLETKEAWEAQRRDNGKMLGAGVLTALIGAPHFHQPEREVGARTGLGKI